MGIKDFPKCKLPFVTSVRYLNLIYKWQTQSAVIFPFEVACHFELIYYRTSISRLIKLRNTIWHCLTVWYD